MKYDVTRKLYYFETLLADTPADTNRYFRLYDAKDSANTTLYQQASVTGDYGITLAAEGSIRENSTVYLSWSESQLENGNTAPVTIYFSPVTKKIFAIPTFDNKTIYLSSGHTNGFKNLFNGTEDPNITVSFSSMTLGNFINDESAVTVTPESGANESWKKVIMTSASSTFTVNAQIGYNSTNKYYKIDHFVVYDLDNMTRATSYEAQTSDDITYSTEITADSSLLIVPVVTLTDAGISEAGVVDHVVYVDAANTSVTEWGGMVAMFISAAIGGTGKDTNASWPGQVMVPTGDTFEGHLYIKSSGMSVNGIVFDNYNSGNMLAAYELQYAYPNTAQTYDYREPVALIETGGDRNTLTFRLKQNNDGYHGQYYYSYNNAINNDSNSSLYALDLSGASYDNDQGNTCYETVKGHTYTYNSN